MTAKKNMLVEDIKIFLKNKQKTGQERPKTLKNYHKMRKNALL